MRKNVPGIRRVYEGFFSRACLLGETVSIMERITEMRRFFVL